MEKLHLERLPHTVELLFVENKLVFRYIDERILPGELKLVDTIHWHDVVVAIKELAVRGAPAIGLAGASALTLWVADALKSHEAFSLAKLDERAEQIASARPTAVNLRWAVERVATEAYQLFDGRTPGSDLDGEAVVMALYSLVKQMEEEDEAACRSIGAHGAKLLPAGARVLTHCNAGSLAMSFYGTALGVVYAAAEQGKIERVYADETRPVGQGARLTAWELARVGVPVTLICDNMAAALMAQGVLDAVVVGADRVARNGDVANKIGTYGVAVLAHEHGIPFYVAAPTTTLDFSLPDGGSIPIEQRNSSEVLAHPIEGVDVWNPAFDVTPACYITAIITENGVYSPHELPSNHRA